MPLIPGVQASRPPGQGGLPYPGGSDQSSYPTTSAGGPAGERVIAKALSYVGTKETGNNTDNGGKIDEWQANFGISNQPWCGCFAGSMFREAGVNDENFGHPYTGTITARAKAAGKHRTANPVKGCYAVKGTQHVTLYIGGPIHQADCVGGNQSDAVTRVTYDLRGWDFAIPSALLVDAQPTPSSTPNNTSAPSGTGTRPPPSEWL